MMACSSSYVTADEVSEFFCRSEGYGTGMPTLDDIERYIKKAAAKINATLSATAQCNCTFNEWAAEYLEELNLIAAALIIRCPDCGARFKQDERDFYHAWVSEQLALLRSGEIDLCDGATAPQYPHVTWAEQSVTDWQAARIIVNDRLRNS